MNKRPLKIVSTGCYLPKKIVSGFDIDRILGLTPGQSTQMSGVKERRYVTNETNSIMGAYALMNALERTPYRFEDLDALICASGSIEQAIPCTAALIQRELKKSASGVPCFDINATCLSFVAALDLASSLIASNRYHRIAIVSSEIASVGLNKNQHEAYSLFGDGAACIVVEKPPQNEDSNVIHALMKTYSDGADYCKIDGGGTRIHPSHWTPQTADLHQFKMDGRKVFKCVLETIPEFYANFMEQAGLTLNALKLVIPHQASGSGMELVRRKLDIPKEKFMDILENHGNMIAASIPLALHYAIDQGRLKRGEKAVLIGTGAGLSLAALAIEY